VIKPGQVWLTQAEAAARVGRSERTLRRWVAQGRLTTRLGRVDEHELFLAERDARQARNTPRGATLQHVTRVT
jgi:predicted site-specific integrase-resolvase